MLIDNIFYYDDKFLPRINTEHDNFYMYFDYDSRSYNINMEFQHFHPFYEMHILLDESANHLIEGKLYKLNKFDIVCLRPQLLHKSQYPEGPSVKRLVIQFNFPISGNVLQKELNEILSIFSADEPIYRFNHNDLVQIIEPLNDIYKLAKGNNPLNKLLIYNKLLWFLSEIYTNKEKSRYQAQVPDAATNKIYKVSSYIHNNFGKDVSLDALSKEFFISPYHLSHQFHAVTGFTLTEYVQSVRIQNAKQMLLFSDRRISEISEACGFASFSQFNRVFNKHCKQSPRDFRTSGGTNIGWL